MIIGILISISGYLLVTDWQTIPYDPCTEYSPFHHPDLFYNNSNIPDKQPVSDNPNFIVDTSFILNPILTYNSKKIPERKYSTYPLNFVCERSTSCPVCGKQANNQLDICLTLVKSKDSSSRLFHRASRSMVSNQFLEIYSCFLEDHNLCLNIYSNSDPSNILPLDVEIQRLMVLPNDVYERASNSCEKALNGQCHWIPFSAITGEKCIDCPQICRGKQQTLLFPLFVIGMALLLFSNPLMWVPTIALANNQTPKSLQVCNYFNMCEINFH